MRNFSRLTNVRRRYDLLENCYNTLSSHEIMTITKEQLIGIFGSIGTAIALVLSTSSWLSSRDESVSRKIVSAQNIIPHCGLEKEEEIRIMDILLQAEQKLNIEGRTNEAVNLLNSINNELLICQPKLEISEPMLMVWTVLGMALILFILIATGKLKKPDDNKRKK